MAEFVYKAGKEPLIIQHENTALALYSEILSEYAPLLEPFACSFKVALYWIDSSTGRRSEQRLPFCAGYTCFIYCEVQRNGKPVRVKSTDGEADHYELSAAWTVSSIGRIGLSTRASLYFNAEEVRAYAGMWYHQLSGSTLPSGTAQT